MSDQSTERGRVGAPKRFGERKACMTRLNPALVERLQNRIAAANEKRRETDQGELSFSEGMAQLLEWALDKIEAKELKQGVSHAAPAVKPAPITVAVFVSELDAPAPSSPPQEAEVKPLLKPPPSDKSSPWSALRSQLRDMVSQETFDMWLEGLEFVSLENCKLTLWAPSPFMVEEIASRFGELVEEIASELTGEAVSVVILLNPAHAAQAAQEAERQRLKAEAKEKEQAERPKKLARLRELYLKQTLQAAKEAERLLFSDEALLGLLGGFQRKQIEQWLSGVSAGASYQQGKEAEYRGPTRRGGRR